MHSIMRIHTLLILLLINGVIDLYAVDPNYEISIQKRPFGREDVEKMVDMFDNFAIDLPVDDFAAVFSDFMNSEENFEEFMNNEVKKENFLNIVSFFKFYVEKSTPLVENLLEFLENLESKPVTVIKNMFSQVENASSAVSTDLTQILETQQCLMLKNLETMDKLRKQLDQDENFVTVVLYFAEEIDNITKIMINIRDKFANNRILQNLWNTKVDKSLYNAFENYAMAQYKISRIQALKKQIASESPLVFYILHRQALIELLEAHQNFHLQWLQNESWIELVKYIHTNQESLKNIWNNAPAKLTKKNAVNIQYDD